MARLPDKSSRFVLISVLIFSLSFLFLDFRFNSFKPIQDFYNSSSIFVKIFSKEFVLNPLYQSVSGLLDAKRLKQENRELKIELNNQLIENYVISNKDIFGTNIFFDVTNLEKLDLRLLPARVISFDINQYYCCDTHRMFLANEVNDEVNSFKVVISKDGIVGQTISINESFFEVILLSDKKHNIPIQNENKFFCEASGLGVPNRIFCDVDLTLWEDEFELNQIIFSSGLGGVFPKGVKIGHISEIKELATDQIRLIVELDADPLASNFFGVLQ